jgi:glycosyltransferase involved in cell wall biosynthesis
MIVVTHDASRTGAPILALNLARVFSNRYNVITVCLRGGDLIADFQKYSTEIHVAEHVVGSGAQYARLLDTIVAKKRPVFAVVNSIESRYILSSLRKHQIPSVALFHEFASYTLPKSAFKDAFLLADEIVFSTELTIENALQETSFVRTPRFHVLPQGRCEVPQSGGAEAMRQVERDRLAAFLRPDGNQEDEFVVIGAGFVHIRKGVDLFIDVARRVAATEVGKKARFVWIGGGYDPERDPAYSVYLRDQIERAELTDRMMLGETSEIDHVYKLSNLLLLTSRLDPLPNVAIDAMSEGIPVICFDKTTGIADVLTDAGLGDACVADYLDTAEAAEKILRLIRSNDSYRRVCERSKNYAARAFDFDGYATQIERWGLEAARLRSNRADDASTIASSADFDPALPKTRHRLASSKTEAAEYYLADGWRASAPSRPEPGFNALIYSRHLEEGGVTGVDAYAEFLRRDRPTGPWLRSVIGEHASPSIGKGRGPLRIALHIHASHPESIAAVANLLSLNETLPDLFINAGDRKGLDLAIESLNGYRGRISEARVALNRGRDLGSLLTEFGGDLVGNYDLIGHVHTQANKHSLGHDRVQIRQEFLWENVLGGQSGGAMMDRIVTAFTENEQLGLVFPATREMFSWSNSGTVARNLARQLGITSLPEFLDFPIGSMFWVRASTLEPLVALGLGWNDYPPEPLDEDGTIVQAIERLLGLVAESRGFDFAVTKVKGISI